MKNTFTVKVDLPRNPEYNMTFENVTSVQSNMGGFLIGYTENGKYLTSQVAGYLDAVLTLSEAH